MAQEPVNDVLQRQKDGDSRLFGESAIELEYIEDGVIAKIFRRELSENSSLIANNT